MATIAIQRRVSPRGIPAPSRLRAWADTALGARRGEITIRIVDERESQALNRDYRAKDKPTNVLSFHGEAALTPPRASRAVPPSPAARARDGGAAFSRDHVLGDLVVCAPVVAREAQEQGKPANAHWAHMVIHGCLHLLGYDHEKSRDARTMEAREALLLRRLGFPDPYR